MLPYRHIQIIFIGILEIDDSVHTLYVLRILIFDYVQNVVEGYYAYEPMFSVNYRHSYETVFFELFCYFLLIFINVYPHIIRVHYIFYLDIIVCHYQGAQRNDPYQFAARIFYVTCIDGLRVHSLFLYMRQGFSYSHLFLQTYIVRRHEASRAGVRIIEKSVYESSLVFRRLLEDLIHQIGGKFLQYIYLIVKVKLLNYIAQLCVGYPVYDL